MTSTFQIYSTENAFFTTIDKNKTLVYAWGQNSSGQLGLNDTKDRSTPTLVELLLDYNFRKASCGVAHTVLMEENGHLLVFGNNKFG
jgi:alpha-tubulin suppressor-like RCC1 family protein